MKIPVVGTALLSCLIGACVYHIDTAIPPDAMIGDGSLVGDWHSADSERAVITEGSGSTYRIEFTDGDGRNMTLHGRLGRLGNDTVLEIWPAFGDAAEDWPAGRQILVLAIAADEVIIRPLNADSIGAALERDRHVSHLARSDNIIITAAAPELIEFLKTYIRRPGYLGEPQVWRRS
jgi:hypothetical protein